MAELTSLTPEIVAEHIVAFKAIAADVPGEYWDSAHFLAALPEKWALSFAAWSEGRPVAYAFLSRKAPDQVHLHHFMVAAAFRSGGLGTRMMDEMVARARIAGARRLTLKVHGKNEAAQRFYRRHGFATIAANGESEYGPMELPL